MLQPLLKALQGSVVDHDKECEAIVLGLISREHVLLVGDPGGAKSMICRSLAVAVKGLIYCERLLSGTTTPEDVFGCLDISAIPKGQWKHIGTGSIQEAHSCLLDEFFRGNDSIKDRLLHILGPERQTQVGTAQVKCPLISAVAASNSYADTEQQAAIMDRWLIRRDVRNVAPNRQRELIDYAIKRLNGMTGPVCELQDVVDAGNKAKTIPFNPDTAEMYFAILQALAKDQILVTDRRKVLAVRVAAAKAVLDDAQEVEPVHLEALGDVLWSLPDHAQKARKIVRSMANPLGDALSSIHEEAFSILDSATDKAKIMVALPKLEELEKKLGKMAKDNKDNKMIADSAVWLEGQKNALVAKALGIKTKV